MFMRLRTDFSTPEPMLARLGTYNFIGTTERMAESLVVLRNILGLSIKDILHLSAKMPGEVRCVSDYYAVHTFDPPVLNN